MHMMTGEDKGAALGEWRRPGSIYRASRHNSRVYLTLSPAGLSCFREGCKVTHLLFCSPVGLTFMGPLESFMLYSFM